MRTDKQEGHIGEYLKFSLFFKQRDAIQVFFLGGGQAVTLSTCIWGTAVLVTGWNIYWRSKRWDTQRPIQRLSFNRSIFLEYQLYTWQTVQVSDGENEIGWEKNVGWEEVGKGKKSPMKIYSEAQIRRKPRMWDDSEVKGRKEPVFVEWLPQARHQAKCFTHKIPFKPPNHPEKQTSKVPR